jgi:integrase
MPENRLTRYAVKFAAARPSEYVLWDGVVRGFGLRVRSSGAKSFIAVYRIGGGRAGVLRKVTIGSPERNLTLDAARTKARAILGAVANGADPALDRARARQEMTVAHLCDLYLREGCATKKQSTLATDRGRIERHIKPLLGRKRLSEVNRADIERFLHDVAVGRTKIDSRTGPRGRAIVKGGKGTASRTVGLLGGIFSFAVNRELRLDNPVRGVKRYQDRKGEKFLSRAELAHLGEQLRDFELKGTNPAATAIIGLLAFTGARKSEIVGLRWKEVDFTHSCLRLGNSKTGPKIVLLGAPAQKLLAELPRSGNTPWVFPASSGQGHYQGVEKLWRVLRIAAGLPNLRLHDLRHSFASAGLAGGDTLPVIGALLGHADVKTTARYAHLAEDPVRLAANRISGAIAAAMASQVNTVAPLLSMRKPAA